MTIVHRRPPITSPEEARARIALWLKAVEVCNFLDIQPRNPKLQEAAIRNRRVALLSYGRAAFRLGHIAPSVGLIALERDTGINRGSLLRTMEAEVRLCRFLKVEERGQKAQNGRVATRYKLRVNGLEDPEYFAAIVGWDTATASEPESPFIASVTPTESATDSAKPDQVPPGTYVEDAPRPAGGSGLRQGKELGSHQAARMHEGFAQPGESDPGQQPEVAVQPSAPDMSCNCPHNFAHASNCSVYGRSKIDSLGVQPSPSQPPKQ